MKAGKRVGWRANGAWEAVPGRDAMGEECAWGSGRPERPVAGPDREPGRQSSGVLRPLTSSRPHSPISATSRPARNLGITENTTSEGPEPSRSLSGFL